MRRYVGSIDRVSARNLDEGHEDEGHEDHEDHEGQQHDKSDEGHEDHEYHEGQQHDKSDEGHEDEVDCFKNGTVGNVALLVWLRRAHVARADRDANETEADCETHEGDEALAES